jgi:hypothetical protein
MRVLVTADLHYDISRSRESARDVARQACAASGDALVLVGDTAGADLGPLRECLGLFERFAGRRLLVPGNHCLWCRQGEDSLHRYETVLPAVAEEMGFSVLDHQPLAAGPVGLVGSVGWYDYSFADESLGIHEDFYRAKVAPGAAAYLQEHRDLVDRHRDRLTAAQLAIGSRWMDGVHVRLPVRDEDFCRTLAEKLSRQLAELAPHVERIAAFVHHLPFADLVPAGRPPRFAFAAAYLGAAQLGQVLLACPKVTHVVCGHSHWGAEQTIGRVNVVNVGSTYVAKRLLTMDI